MAAIAHIFVASKHGAAMESLEVTFMPPLRGKRFRVGDAVFEGLELCEPCISGGEIRVGRSIETLDGGSL